LFVADINLTGQLAVAPRVAASTDRRLLLASIHPRRYTPSGGACDETNRTDCSFRRVRARPYFR
jgi:hypothetical protein